MKLLQSITQVSLLSALNLPRSIFTTGKCGVVMCSDTSVCLYVCVGVCCLGCSFRKPWPRKFIFGMHEHLQARTSRSSGQGNSSKSSNTHLWVVCLWL